MEDNNHSVRDLKRVSNVLIKLPLSDYVDEVPLNLVKNHFHEWLECLTNYEYAIFQAT